MALITSQQLLRYYDQYRDLEVGFTRQVVRVLGLLPKEVHLKCQGDVFPCVIYSSSLREAKVVASLRPDSVKRIKSANNLVSLRFCFARPDRVDPLSFFVSARVAGRAFYDPRNPELLLLSLEYTHKPPDDLIELLGELLEANVNASRRKEARVDVHPASMKGLGLESKEAGMRIGERSGRCIIRDLSFSGARVLLFGASEQLVGARAVLEPSFAAGTLSLPGSVLRYEAIAGREDIGALAVRFDEDKIPMSYKLAVNNYLRGHPQADARPPRTQPPEQHQPESR
jgi:hypothetical protein